MFLPARHPMLVVLPLVALLWLASLSLAQLATPMPPISIQAMINAAPDGGTVNIGPGTYYESLTIDKNITLSGVSSATTEIRAIAGQRVITVTTGRDLHLVNLAITGGQAAGEVGGGIKFLGGSLFIDYCLLSGNSADYGGAIFQDGASNRVRLTGSRLENNWASVDGGGMFVRGDLVVQQTDVLTNSSGRHGGGIHAEGSSVRVSGGIFSNNRTLGGNGGAINSNNSLSIAGSRFITNSAGQSGGAVLQYNTGWPVEIADVLFERNGATIQGGGLSARGNVTFTGGALVSNTVIISGANTAGGGAYFGGNFAYVDSTTVRGNQTRCQNCIISAGGGLAFSTVTSGDVRASSFVGNYAWSGGGISSDSMNLSVRDSVFTMNSGGYGAGLDARSATIRTSQFLTNSVVNMGGAVSVGMDLVLERSRFVANSAGAGGGAVRSGGALSAENLAFISNTSQWGGSVLRLENPFSRSLSHLTITKPGQAGGEAIVVTAGIAGITNTIIASYTTGITVSAGASVMANGLLWSNILTRSTGSGTFSADGEWFGKPALAADGYHLLAGSPAIDHGVDSGIRSDIDGNIRPLGAGFDIGAVEYPRYRSYLPLVRRS